MSEKAARTGLLDLIERIGNRLPDANTLFLIGTILVALISWLAVANDWSVTKRLPETITEELVDPETGEVSVRPVLDPDTGKPQLKWVETDEVVKPVSLLNRDGIFWAFKNLVKNFINFAPLGLVLAAMMGIGVSEYSGLLAAMLKGIMVVVPRSLLTPTMVFAGIMSSMTLDAGYIVLPPLAAALYKSVGRSPLVGIAAVFAGVSAGFNANLFITSLDPLLAGLSTAGAKIIDPSYEMNPACNWWFMIASTFVMTGVGWAVTAFFVERRLKSKSPDEGGPATATDEDLAAQKLKAAEIRGLWWAGGSALAVLGIFAGLIMIPGAPLHGEGDTFDRWVEALVPILFFAFVIPGIVYGVVMKSIKNDKDVAKLFIKSMAAMAPIIVLAFFAAQFIEWFGYTNLGRMLALAGGQALAQMALPPVLLVLVFIGLTMVFNMFVGSMSAKYAMFAPIFIPMFMLVGISPELTQAAYRIGDSVTNIITPLNAYLVIVVVFMQRFVPKSGMGTLISTMLPYTIVFTIVWSVMIVIWMLLGIPLGPDGGLTYDVTAAAAGG